MPIVDTSVAVAMPSITAARIRKGRASAGKAMRNARNTAPGFARVTPRISSEPERYRAMSASASASTAAGIIPPVNSAAIETPVTEPIVISTSEGGIVSLIAPDAASSETNSP